ncbi:MAG TPA: rhomboid family intramembrane serine protease [Candidatus Eisenbacteria bacterium]|nr:rhomboid family intramembrane serine protease [Candidatus Eisenbacteria bacterium]
MYYFYWLPIGTDAKVPRMPWVTLTLALATAAMFAGLHLTPGAVAGSYAWAFKAAHPTVGSAIASLFLHADPLHLLGNLIFLGVFGPPLENRIGGLRFVICYLACGWLSNLAQAAMILARMPELASVPIIGASGAISGLMGLFLVRLHFAHLRFASITMLLLHGVVRPAKFTLPAVAGIVLWFGLTLFESLAIEFSGTAYVAHLGGALLGALFGISMGLAPEARLERLRTRAERYAARGDWFAALGELEAYLSRVPGDPDVLAEAARIQRVTHQERQAAERFREAIRIWLRDGDLRKACDGYDEMKRLLGGDVGLPPADLLRVARASEELGRPSEASRAYEAYGRRYPERQAAALALLKSAEIEGRLLNNPGRARYLYDQILRLPLSEELRAVTENRRRSTERALERQTAAAG